MSDAINRYISAANKESEMAKEAQRLVDAFSAATKKLSNWRSVDFELPLTSGIQLSIAPIVIRHTDVPSIEQLATAIRTWRVAAHEKDTLYGALSPEQKSVVPHQ